MAKTKKDVSNLQQLVDRIAGADEEDGRVTLGEIVESVGTRSFGPLLLMAGVIMASPLSAVPTMPTTMGVLVLLIAGQLLFRRNYFWLPRVLLKRSLQKDKIKKGIKFLRPVARFVDRLLKPRLQIFVEGVSVYLIAVNCIFIALCGPMMEVVPLSVHGAGVALTAFGLALIACDGLLALIAFLVTAASIGSIVYHIAT